MRTTLPVARPSTMKSIAHSWLGRIRRFGSNARSRTRRLRLRRRTASHFLRIEPVDTLHVDLVTSPFQHQRMRPPIPVARLLPRQLYQFLAQFDVAVRPRLIPVAHDRSTPSSLQAVRSLRRNCSETNATSPLRPASSSRFFGSPPSAPHHADSAPPPAASGGGSHPPSPSTAAPR